MLSSDESSESDMTVVSIEEGSDHAHGETDPLLGQGESENSAGMNVSQAEMEQRMALLLELMRRMEEENNRPQRDVENQTQQDDTTNTLMNELRNQNIPITAALSVVSIVRALPFLVIILSCCMLLNIQFLSYFILICYIPHYYQKKFVKTISPSDEVKPLEVIKMIIPTIVPTVFVYMVTGNQLWLNSIFYLKTVDQIHIMDILQRVVISDGIIKAVCLTIKMLISIIPIPFLSFRAGIIKRRQLYSVVEHVFYVIRLFQTTKYWLVYFQGNLMLFGMLYKYCKLVVIVREALQAISIINAMFNTSILFGERVSLRSTDNQSCSICMDQVSNPIKLSCGHIFCEDCIMRWFEKENSCPLCRKKVKNSYYWIHSDGSQITSVQWF